MPTLNWIGKEKVVSHHQDVPYRVLEHKYGFTSEEAEQTEPTNSGNKIIHGDNLEALKSLLPEYEGKVKCIYIDPPYNTGNESWVYNDNVNHPKIKKWLGEVVGKDGEDLTRHDKWLCMMYPRLKLLHKLLADDGAIFISIDDNEQANLKLICDEIFGISNFITNVIWEKKSSPQNDAKWFSDTHDFVLFYSKSKQELKINKLKRTEEQNAIYKNCDEFDGIDKNGNLYGRGPWFAGDMTVKTVNENALYPITTPSGKIVYPAKGRAWVYFEDKFKDLCNDNRITFGKSGSNKPCIKRFLTEIENNGIVPKTNWHFKEVGENRNARQELKYIFDEIQFPFQTPKPSKLVERILQIASDKNSIILDSFAGSGTTAHAVLNLNKQDGGNRKFILIEMEDYANDITAERVKRVAKGYGTGAKAVAGTGGAFDFYELGLPLFDENQNLNEKVCLAKIKEYIWFSETRTSFSEPNKEPYFLGKKDESAYYFIYEKDRLTTLDYDALELIKTKGEQYVIYADNCLLPKDFMAKKNIIFKKIPRDITRF
jgi:adenine-specific DNA-methyltransferase